MARAGAPATNLDWNRQMWDNPESWEKEWKEGYAWGNRPRVWKEFLQFLGPVAPLPAIAHAMQDEIPGGEPSEAIADGTPRPRTLEIACGMGRFTEFLLAVSKSVHSIDLAKHCVEACQERFGSDERFSAELTDGKSLPEGEFDLIASYDSLVHADFDVIRSYFEQAPSRLRHGGIIAIHHANAPDPNCSRFYVSAELVGRLVSQIDGLEIMSQTLFRYTEDRFVDCFTTARCVKA